MGEDVDRQECDPAIVTAVFAEWRNLRTKHRPKRPATLMRILGDLYQYPHPEYLRPGEDEDKLKSRVDQAFDDLLVAATTLSATLPMSDHWHVLAIMLDERLTADVHEKAMLDLHALEEFLPRLAKLQLMPRPTQTKRGPPMKSPGLRIIAQAVCWYLAKIENAKPKSGFKDDTGTPTSKAARLLEATYKGMGYTVPPAQIKTHLDAVKNLQFNEMDFWDLISVLGSDVRL